MRPARRNDQYANYQGHRDYLLQDKFPTGQDGYVVEDVDLLIRGYGPLFKTDGKGKFMLIEIKYYPHEPEYAQKKTFGMLDELLRAGDAALNGNNLRYLGYFVVQYDDPDWNKSKFWVNGKRVLRSEFDEFISLGVIENMEGF